MEEGLAHHLAEPLHLRLGALGPPPPPPREEARLRGLRHTLRRDREAVSHHYDVGNDFYRLLLGPSLVYSCAYFASPSTSLEEAQEAKLDHPRADVLNGIAYHPSTKLLIVTGKFWPSTYVLQLNQ